MLGATIENISASFILPYANCDLNLTTTELGLFSSMPFCGIVVTAYFWGFLADTIGRRRVILFASFLTFFSSFLSGFMTNTFLLILSRFFVGCL